MNNEEKYLKERMGTGSPFTVPDGYFDQLTAQVMSRLPQEQTTTAKPAIVRQLRPLLYAAACIGVAIAGLTVYWHTKAEADTLRTAQQEMPAYSDSYIDEAADYAMFDNEEIYASLLADM